MVFPPAVAAAWRRIKCSKCHLVDFRGFDTFGEITVLGIAAIGVLCLMDGMRAHGTTMTQGLTFRFNPSPLMLRSTASWVLPLAPVVSLYIFLRGHNYPEVVLLPG